MTKNQKKLTKIISEIAKTGVGRNQRNADIRRNVTGVLYSDILLGCTIERLINLYGNFTRSELVYNRSGSADKPCQAAGYGRTGENTDAECYQKRLDGPFGLARIGFNLPHRSSPPFRG